MSKARTAIVSFKELGSNCWLPRRFIEGNRCPRMMRCRYPERKTCKAVDTEIRHLNQRLADTQKAIAVKIARLVAYKERR